MSWFVYILKCADSTLYTGITTDPERRTQEHNGSKKGARYTRAKLPVHLVYTEAAENRAEASRREWQIKQLTRRQKLQLIGKAPHE